MNLGKSIECPNCLKTIVVPKKSYDRSRVIGGNFVIDRVIGSGGMGTVYLAKQISLDRDVALKVLARKFSVDDKFRLEFQREARAASRLTHSNLVQSYAFGEDEGDLFLAMEFVDGVTMGDRLDNETRLNIDEALNIIQQVAEGLHFAWTQEQLIHRDIKPDNIMLTSDGHAKLTDMGLARTAVELENVTEVSGTPAYMNPEQFTKQAMDCRADIYSLGVCLYHGVTGQLPFDSQNVRELARQHIQDKVEFPDKIVDLPADLKKLIRKMMNKNREDRHANHEELLHDIYKTRLSINGSENHIPSVHTISFNRYEFKNLKPQKKNEDDEAVNTTKQLPRKQIKPLSHATSKFSTSLLGSEGGSRTTNILLNNLVALIVVVAAIILAFSIGGDEESPFYQESIAYLESITPEDSPVKIIEKVDELLAKEFSADVNKKDYYVKNRLLELKLKYSNLLLEKRNNENKALNNKIEDLQQERRKLSILQSKLEEESNQQLKNLQRELDLARLSFKNIKSPEVKETTVATTHSFSEAIAVDLQLLDNLWTEKKAKIRVAILKEFATGKYSNALKIITDVQNDYKGIYRAWLDSQKIFIENSRDVAEYIELNLNTIRDSVITINNRTIYVTRVYPQSMEIDSEGEIIKLKDISVKDLLGIYNKICSANGVEPLNAAAYAVSKLDFNTAYELAPNNGHIVSYAMVYLDERISIIARLYETGERDKAEDMAKKTYAQCSKLTTITPNFKLKINKIFGRDVLLGIE